VVFSSRWELAPEVAAEIVAEVGAEIAAAEVGRFDGGRAGSVWAFGMMDHRSLKLCAAAGAACIPINIGAVAIATILENRRMITSQNKMNNAASRGSVPG
jgi:hypothetical protein